MITIPAKMFASVASFVGGDYNNINNVHINICPEKSYIEAVNGHAFCQHDLDNTDISEEKHILIAPTKELVKACKVKDAKTLEIMEDLSVRVMDSRGNVAYIHPVNAKTCDAGQYPDTSIFINRVNNLPEGFTGIDRISLPCSTFDLLKAAFGKDAIYNFTFTGEKNPIKISVYNTDFLVIAMPMLKPSH